MITPGASDDQLRRRALDDAIREYENAFWETCHEYFDFMADFTLLARMVRESVFDGASDAAIASQITEYLSLTPDDREAASLVPTLRTLIEEHWGTHNDS